MESKSNSWLDQLKKPKKKKGMPLLYIVIAVGIGILFMFTENFFASPEPSKMVLSEKTTSESEPAFAKKDSNPSTISEYENHYETQLKEALDEVKGVSNATVIVNLDSTEEKIIEKNRTSTDKYTYESPNEGGSRKIEEQSSEEQVVVIQDDNGQGPIVVSTRKPTVRGVVVVAEGAENAQTKKMIVDAVTRLLEVKSHRVMVLPKNQKGDS
ncbi:stage III sporulation protein AG [Guptibacillus algicola]|uniref:stage III sporulation protein AG n=1 Tax=Guptibacillus algicola TaxID=225844 RepID=UPI001CD74F8B|nr:stage III sporulation protein AG [Alkalihalobacillus algicola]MCA0985976.1 stage III sporulation protein AG [Alkalihalobacillus algicola]